MRTVFFGTPPIAVPALRALAESSELVGVVCQPDRPAGRGLALREPAVKVAARDLGLEVHQPVKVKTGTLDHWLRERAPDVALVLAYGRILPPAVLAAPRCGCMNLHASLLPRLRGAAPINWAIINGFAETGVSLMQMDEGLDTGPVYCMRRLAIGAEETAGELAVRIGELAADMTRDELPRAVAGELEATAQDHDQASHAPPLGPEHRILDWSRAATALHDQIRGLAPRPGAVTTIGGRQLRIARGAPSPLPAAGPAGRVTVWDRARLLVATGDGTLEIQAAQLEGRRELPARDLANGRALKEGDVLGA